MISVLITVFKLSVLQGYDFFSTAGLLFYKQHFTLNNYFSLTFQVYKFIEYLAGLLSRYFSPS